MKYLITGGNRGLGKSIKDYFNADSLSRTENNIDITKDVNAIVQKSLDYDVFINNAFDGPPQEAWANFAQITLLIKMFEAWKNADKRGFIFNIGSIGSDTVVSPVPSWETYRVSKKALESASLQCSKAFRDNVVKFKTVLIKPDRLDTELSRSKTTWTENGINCNDISKFIEYALSLNDNTQVDEITLALNYEYGKNQ